MIVHVKVLPKDLNITHDDQELLGLSFECIPYNGFVYVKIEASDKIVIDSWIQRVKALEIDISVYGTDVRASKIEGFNNRKSQCQNEINDIDAKLLAL